MATRTTTTRNGELAYREAGAGPLAVLVHGFPDDAHTWEHQVPALVEHGYRVVTPFLRGYPPSPVPEPGAVNQRGNTEDVADVIESLAGGAPAFLIGHDWGALATFNVLAARPELVERAVVVSASHPATLIPLLEMPDVVHHLFHVWFFQLEGFAESSARANDFELLEYLWRHWTADGHDDAEHIARLKADVFGRPGVVEALLPYYRALVRLPVDEPDFLAAAFRPTTVPVLSLWGADDPARAASVGEEPNFAAEYRREVVPGAGHFVHREQPQRFTELLLEWLPGGGGAAAGAADTPAAATP